MNLKTCFVREEQPYNTTELFSIAGIDATAGEKFLSLLLSYGILVPVKQCRSGFFFKFTFVGIIFFDSFVLRSFPKYIRRTNTPHTEFALVMNVIRRYNRKEKTQFKIGGEDEYMEFNLISNALSLLDDYTEYGLYSNIIHESEFNSDGEILWDKTISSTEPFFNNDVPFYMEFYTKKTLMMSTVM